MKLGRPGSNGFASVEARKTAQTGVAFTVATHPSATIVAMSERRLLLITAADCHLCAHARAVLTALGLEAREVDVESPEAQELATEGVPLAFRPVLCDGKRVLAYGRLSERVLRRTLAA